MVNTKILQQNTFENLANLGSVPKMTVRELLEHCGDNAVGLGTLHNKRGKVVGELTVVDGEAYISKTFYRQDGNDKIRTKKLEGKGLDQLVYFAQIGYIPKEKLSEEAVKPIKIEINNFQDSDFVKNYLKNNNERVVSPQEVLQAYIESHLEGIAQKGRYVFTMEATFLEATFRSVNGSRKFDFDGGARKPKNLAEVIGKQLEETFDANQKFQCAGIFNKMGGGGIRESPEGLHIHGINDQHGGHLHIHKMKLQDATITVMPVEQWLILTRVRDGRKAHYANKIEGINQGQEFQVKSVTPKASVEEIKEIRAANSSFTAAGYGIR